MTVYDRIVPGACFLLAGSGFGVVEYVNVRQGVAFVLMQNTQRLVLPFDAVAVGIAWLDAQQFEVPL